MWIAVLLVLLVTGAIFYGLAVNYVHLLDYKNNINITRNPKKPAGN